MSCSVSSFQPCRDRRALTAQQRLRVVICGSIGVLWAALAFLRLSNTVPEDSVTACLRAIYRDPVTGREQGIGGARIAPDGAITCRGMTYRAGRR